MADLKGRPTRMHMGSILVGSYLSISHIQTGGVIIRLYRIIYTYSNQKASSSRRAPEHPEGHCAIQNGR